MDSFSRDELDYVTKSLQQGIRLDCRDLDESREMSISEGSSSQPDKSMVLKRGLSEIELRISFKLSAHSVVTIQLPNEILFMDRLFGNLKPGIIPNQSSWNRGINPDDYRTIETKHLPPNPSIAILEKFLIKFKIGVTIEVGIRKNDGNVFDMIFDGIRHAFASIKVPDVNDLKKEIDAGVDLPKSTSYAVFETSVISDPTLIEETAALGVIHVFKDKFDKVINFVSEKSINKDRYKSLVEAFANN